MLYRFAPPSRSFKAACLIPGMRINNVSNRLQTPVLRGMHLHTVSSILLFYYFERILSQVIQGRNSSGGPEDTLGRSTREMGRLPLSDLPA